MHFDQFMSSSSTCMGIRCLLDYSTCSFLIQSILFLVVLGKTEEVPERCLGFWAEVSHAHGDSSLTNSNSSLTNSMDTRRMWSVISKSLRSSSIRSISNSPMYVSSSCLQAPAMIVQPDMMMMKKSNIIVDDSAGSMTGSTIWLAPGVSPLGDICIILLNV